MNMRDNQWGIELMVDAFGCKHDSICSKKNIKAFLKCLVNEIDMVSYGNPIIKHFGSADKKGYTAIQLIETSNISCHFSEDTDTAFFNIFSCKNFDEDIVMSVIHGFFAPEHHAMWTMSRGLYFEK